MFRNVVTEQVFVAEFELMASLLHLKPSDLWPPWRLDAMAEWSTEDEGDLIRSGAANIQEYKAQCSEFEILMHSGATYSLCY
jgi:hypothetical protein